MTEQIERLESTLAELRGERATLEATLTRDDLVRSVEEWFKVARAHAAGSSRLVLNGQASGEHLTAVLAEDRLDDDGLAARTVARLEAQGFGELSDRQKGSKLKALDEKIAAAVADLREVRKREAFEEVERQFAGEAA
jgi:hypothetical protein